MRVGILTGGGDAPGLNSVIFGALLRAYKEKNVEVVGIKKGWEVFAKNRDEITPDVVENYTKVLDISVLPDDLHTIGGTILYTSRTNPFKAVAKIVDHIVEIDPQNIAAHMGLFLKHALLGNKEKALQAVTPQLAGASRGIEFYSRFMADSYALIDEKEEAVNWLRNDMNLGFVNYPYLAEYNPLIENIRGDEQFQELLEEIRKRWEQFEV